MARGEKGERLKIGRLRSRKNSFFAFASRDYREKRKDVKIFMHFYTEKPTDMQFFVSFKTISVVA
jgi:hypothetical protein